MNASAASASRSTRKRRPKATTEHKPPLLSGRFARPQAAFAAIAGSVGLVWLVGIDPPVWVIAASVTVFLVVMFCTVRGVLITDWLIVALRFWRGRRARLRQLAMPEPIDITVTAGTCGIRSDGDMLISMIQLIADSAAPLIMGGETFFTDDSVPIDLLGELMDQYGLELDSITISTAGRKVPSPTDSVAYSTIYGQRVRDIGAWTQGTTWLIIRMNPYANLREVIRRGRGAKGALATHAAATLRIAHRLRLAGHPCQTLSAVEFTEAEAWLQAGVGSSGTLKEHWSSLTDHDNRVENFWATGAELASLSHWMTPSALDCAISTRMTRDAAGRLHAAAIVRYISPRRENLSEIPRSLTRFTGNQSRALMAALPGGEVSSTQTPSALLDLDNLTVPIGATGQIIGVYPGRDGDAPVAIRLVDLSPIPGPQSTIVVHAGAAMQCQLALRAAGSGASVLISTREPGKWATLVKELAAPERVRLHRAGDTRPPLHADLIIIDSGAAPPPQTSKARTVMLTWDNTTPLPHRAANHSLRIEEDPDRTGFFKLVTPRLPSPVSLRMDRHPAERRFLMSAAVAATN